MNPNKYSQVYQAVCSATEDEQTRIDCWIDAVELPLDMFIQKWGVWLEQDNLIKSNKFILDNQMDLDDYYGENFD